MADTSEGTALAEPTTEELDLLEKSFKTAMGINKRAIAHVAQFDCMPETAQQKRNSIHPATRRALTAMLTMFRTTVKDTNRVSKKQRGSGLPDGVEQESTKGKNLGKAAKA
jgi:hypothetical protein